MKWEDLKTTFDMAKELGIGVPALRKWVKLGLVPEGSCKYVGREYFFNAPKIRRWFRNFYKSRRSVPKWKYNITIWLDEDLRSRITSHLQNYHVTKTDFFSEAARFYLDFTGETS